MKNLYELKINSIPYSQKSYFRNSNNFICQCTNYCSCFCTKCGCLYKCQSYENSKRRKIESDNFNNVNHLNKNLSQLNIKRHNRGSSLQNLNLKSSLINSINEDYNNFNCNSLNNIRVKNSNSEIDNILHHNINSLKNRIIDDKKSIVKIPTAPNSTPSNSFNKRINDQKKMIKNKLFKGYNNDSRKKAKMEFEDLLNSFNDNEDNENDNSKSYKRQNSQIDDYQKMSVNIDSENNNNNKRNNVRTLYSYNGNRINDNIKNRRNNSMFFITNSNLENLTAPNESNLFLDNKNSNSSFSKEKLNEKNNGNIFNYERNKYNNPIKPNNQNLYKEIPKNPRNNVDKIIKQYNYNKFFDIQSFNFHIFNNYVNNEQEIMFKKLKNENENLKNEISKKNKNNYNLNLQLSNLQNDLLSSKNVLNNLQKNNNENKNLKNEVLYYKNQLLNLSKENNELIQNIENLQKELNTLINENKRLSNEKKNFKNLQSENKKMKEQINNYEKLNSKQLEIKVSEDENQKLIQQIIDYKKNISTLINDNKKLTNQRISEQKTISELIEKNTNLNNEIMNNQIEILSLKEKNKNLLKKINILENKKSKKDNNDKLKTKIDKNQIKLFKNLLIKSENSILYKGNQTPNNTNNSILFNDSYKKKSLSSNTSKQIINISTSTYSSKLMNKLKIENDLSQISLPITKKKFVNNIEELGENLIFKIYTLKNIMCYDFKNKEFCLFDFADYNNFKNNYITEKNNGNIFISYNSILYIITGKNSDFFYCFNPQKKSMEKLCSLNNNHSKGSLISFQNSIICLSGEHNKKCEIYSINKNKWNEIAEMNFERSEFGTCIINNKYLFALFGFNSPKNEYLNNIEFLDLLNENSLWKNLDYKSDNISLYIKGFLALNYLNNKIIIVGGFNGEFEKPIENFIQIILGENFENEIYIENVDRKLKDIQKYKNYIFSTNITERKDEQGRIFNVAYDNDDRIHIFEIQNMINDVFKFE